MTKINCVILLVLLVLVGCAPKPLFKVANATKTNWYAGKETGPNGLDYNIFINLTEGNNPVFDSIWIDGWGGKLETKKMNSTLYEVKTTFITKGNADFGVATSLRIEAPVSYKGAALISYKVDHELKYFVIKEFTATLPVYMP
ncbi:MAG: hypothetical protein WCK82_09750 [Bacteroidota bacterium]